MCIAFLSDPLLSSRSKRGFETFPSQLNQSIMEFDPFCLCVRVVQKGIVQIYMKLVPGISTTLMKEVITLHCRVVYQSNVLHFEREEGETKSPQVKKKKKKHFEPSIITSSLFLINKWIPFCCASVRQDVTDAARTKEKHKKRSSFLTFT